MKLTYRFTGHLHSLPRFFFFILFYTCLFLVQPAQGVGTDSFNPHATQKELEELIQVLQGKEADPEEIDSHIKRLQSYATLGKECVILSQEEVGKINTSLATLGAPLNNEPREISQERTSLTNQKNMVETRLATCRLLVLKASELEASLKKTKQDLFTRDLFFRGPTIIEVFSQIDSELSRGMMPYLVFFQTRSGVDRLGGWWFIAAVLVAMVGGFLGRRLDIFFIRRIKTFAGQGFIATLQQVLSTRRTFCFPLCTMAGAVLFIWLFLPRHEPAPYLPWASLGLLLSVTLYTFGSIYLQILTSERPIDTQQPVKMNKGRGHLFLLALLVGLLFFMITSPIKTAVPQSPYLFIRALTIATGYAVLLWLFWLLCHSSRLLRWRRVIRLFLALLMGCVMLIELGGYRNLADHLLTGTAGSLVIFLSYAFSHSLVHETIGGLSRGKYPWQRHLRRELGLDETGVMKSLVWTNSLAKLLLVAGVLYALLLIWGFSAVYASTFSDWMFAGFTVATYTIVPSRITIGFLVFTVAWTLIFWLKIQLERRWLVVSEYSPGAQEALATVFGYICYSIAVIIGLGIAGINFSGLAVIAGALSVGIGFGLQNVVNNFVSGLILLFERPIKRGDWIAVGSTEGYVKKISVRSTIIQTFDRSDVIVPNSELISNQVTNMMFNDQQGRLRVQVGVAYGSNTALVGKILLEVAQAHPEVIVDGAAPEPQVRFQNFGESSLDFELFCHLKNIDNKIRTRSDLNFAIDNAFREHGIEIPFPQRDLHIKSDQRQHRDEEHQSTSAVTSDEPVL